MCFFACQVSCVCSQEFCRRFKQLIVASAHPITPPVQAVVSGDILPQLVYSLSEQNRFYKKAAAFVLRAVAKHSPELAQVGRVVVYLVAVAKANAGHRPARMNGGGRGKLHSGGYSFKRQGFGRGGAATVAARPLCLVAFYFCV